MALQIGIVGLPNVGKSTLFNALTRSKGAEAANYPFCTIEPNVGIVEVPDSRLSKLAAICNPKKIIPAAIEFVDIAGLVKGASKGEGLGNQFLHAIREVDAICHVIRSFEDRGITHVDGDIDPKRDLETIETELILADCDTIENRIDKTEGGAKSGDKEKIKELSLLKQVFDVIQQGKRASSISFNEEEDLIAKNWNLLTYKPLIYALNVSEDSIESIDIKSIRDQLKISDSEQIILISAKIEEDLQNLKPEEAAEFLNELGITSSGLDKLIHAAYAALGYITYFTAGEMEVRAWNIKVGMTAPQAAGVIHTDFEKGFIRAETIHFDDFVNLNGEQKAKEAGKMRAEGKEYVVQDGDVMHFRFNV
ncbi:redox-regulated ATPase YchF [Candidatus Peregrinibacteria bacterium]|nr:redox-regulated ATPase YchF [Candidatus Peregrinibacteria bacterium]MBT4585609.1 redox-regulated ATPase YchF [Candidatus Peregrinibacteria bacterium]